MGGATYNSFGLASSGAFQSTLPVGGATDLADVEFFIKEFQSTLPVGGATVAYYSFMGWFYISIHAPRGGSDYIIKDTVFNSLYFNPRSPWGERPIICLALSGFLPYFNPRSPWGERQIQYRLLNNKLNISIHAPRGGSDYNIISIYVYCFLFQSTLPVGGATLYYVMLF